MPVSPNDDNEFIVEEDSGKVVDGDPAGPEGATEYDFSEGETIPLELAQKLGLKGAPKAKKDDSGK